ncbi:MAG: hypothetical protein K5925_02730 [Bacilli bacterium]|nr:hypothetical protein [Bacilli bacterium]
MANSIQDIYREFLNHSKEERLELARNAAGVVIHFLGESGLKDEDQLNFFFSAVGLFVAADGKVTDAEAELFNQLLGTELSGQDLANGFARSASVEFINAMDEIIDSMPEDDKNALCILGLTFLASDGELTQREIAVFEKILA